MVNNHKRWLKRQEQSMPQFIISIDEKTHKPKMSIDFRNMSLQDVIKAIRNGKLDYQFALTVEQLIKMGASPKTTVKRVKLEVINMLYQKLNISHPDIKIDDVKTSYTFNGIEKASPVVA